LTLDLPHLFRQYISLLEGVVDHLADQLDSVGLLAEPVRRALYQHVAAQPESVSREQAAGALGVPLHTAKFHLDRLVDAGLLDVEFRRLSGKTGPGAGRPSKLYRRSDRQLSVSLPERRYDVAGEVLAAAVDRSLREGAPLAAVLAEVAHDVGRRLGSSYAERDEAEDGLTTTAGVLGEYGYEPVLTDAELCLANCPFDRLAAEHTELVCGMNRDLVEGVLEGAGVPDLQARLAPHAGLCCVRVSR
jgi:predicted ArsR family transcriptional regulator